MKSKYLNFLSGLILSGSCLINIANAGLIDTDSDSFIDSNTQLEWIDFGINNDMSYDQVVDQLVYGGTYYGWRLATSEEVYEMWSDTFLELGALHEDLDYYGLGQFKLLDGKNVIGSVFSDAFSVIGFNAAGGGGYPSGTGLFEGTDGLSSISFNYYAKSHLDIWNWDGVSFRDDSNLDAERTNIGSGLSTMLIKVPEPSSLGIFALSIMGLATYRFKKN